MVGQDFMHECIDLLVSLCMQTHPRLWGGKIYGQLWNLFSVLCLLSHMHGHTGLISSWNNDALLFLREKLKLNVSKNTDLLHKLDKATGGFLNEYVATMVRELPSNIAQVGRVIETLCEKGDKDFQKFCRILRDSKEVIWADEIERVAEQLKRGEGNILLWGVHTLW